MGNCTDCLSKDKHELISDYINHLPIKSTISEIFMKEVDGIFKKEDDRNKKEKEDEKRKSIYKEKDIVNKQREYKDYILIKLFSRFLLVKLKETSSRTYYNDIKSTLKKYESQNDTNGVLYFMLSLLILSKKRGNIENVYYDMRKLSLLYFHQLNMNEEIEKIDELFKIVKSEDKFNYQTKVMEYKEKKYIKREFYKKIIWIYLKMITDLIIKPVSSMIDSAEQKEFESYWEKVFSSENKYIFYDKLFTQGENIFNYDINKNLSKEKLFENEYIEFECISNNEYILIWNDENIRNDLMTIYKNKTNLNDGANLKYIDDVFQFVNTFSYIIEN